MSNLKARLRKMEAPKKLVSLTAAECERLIDLELAKEGLTREAIIEKYGSMADYAYAKMCTGPSLPIDPGDTRTAEERYMDLIGKQVVRAGVLHEMLKGVDQIDVTAAAREQLMRLERYTGAAYGARGMTAPDQVVFAGWLLPAGISGPMIREQLMAQHGVSPPQAHRII